MDLGNPISAIQRAKHAGKLSFSNHALERMLERYIRVEQIEQALNCSSVQIVENYVTTGRQESSCLILGLDDTGVNIHILVAYPSIEVITTYEPTLPRWITPKQRGV
jgi:hypothetical protein